MRQRFGSQCLDRDARSARAKWVLTVNDNGSGFDAVSTARGVGLREVVVGELEREGYAVAVTSRVGDGTTATITYRRAAS